ncbi:ABC transporter permease subunit [Pseudomonas veronii]|jgi:taurine transport system permease protein|uniref:ABC transporter permease subunit n=3 Tax=Pseudomonas TaxID=286 RepID=A0A7Y1ACX1_PSEVE|nr:MULTISPECIES: ABC transporter permease subunit [Pseudomonas]MBI6554437.1 ABC transporter permease subunit [Pseudomonas veronii]MBI6649347.1 ABC transporter permease subunit [Pseudomonas veronii]MCI1739615.1 ABC transporter permease subunit [Pseudomonas veronii]MDF3240810.1 ABC transporter permease subunit [Pseudomonas veronii]NMY13455.1 ABC transporter permease subunit [Pseudomonas veronii]
MSLFDEKQRRAVMHTWSELRRAAPARPGEQYGAPGNGSSLTLSLATLCVVFGTWYVATNGGWIKPLFLPSPQAVWAQLVDVFQEGFADATLLTHIGWSALRVFGAFVLAVLTAIPVGILMGVNRVARGIFDPLVEFYRPLPPLAYLPLVVIWMGIGEGSKILLIYLAMFAPLALSARAGVKSVAIEQIHAAYSMGASRAQVLKHVIMPAALPEVLTGMRIAIGFGWTTLVAAEMVAATAGLGFMVLTASKFMATDVVIMGILVIGAMALLFDLGMRWLERKLVPWKGKV